MCLSDVVVTKPDVEYFTERPEFLTVVPFDLSLRTFMFVASGSKVRGRDKLVLHCRTNAEALLNENPFVTLVKSEASLYSSEFEPTVRVNILSYLNM